MQGSHVKEMLAKADSGIVTFKKVYAVKNKGRLTSEGAMTISFITSSDHASNDIVCVSVEKLPTDTPGIPLSNKEEYDLKFDMSLKEE